MEILNFFRIEVEDEGVGISAENISKLFCPFTKIMENRGMNTEGCGLGLTISKNLAKAMGGDIIVESEKGKGSKFALILPLKG
jgi:two-component system, sensor histidine kinase and response regulator